MIGHHYTDHDIVTLNYEDLRSNITNHANGALGLWYAKNGAKGHEWASGFGKNRFLVNIPCLREKGFSLTVEKLATMISKSADYHEGFRSALLALGHTHIDIVESNGESHMGVLLDFDNVEVTKA